LQAFPGPWEHLTIGAQRTCGARQGRLWCWGDNSKGHFLESNAGTSAPQVLAEPTLVEDFPRGIVAIDIEGIHVCTLDKASQVTCKLAFRQLLTYPNLPKNVEEIAAGSSTVCVRTRQEVWCHGGEPWALEGGDPSSTAWVFSPKPLNLVKVEGIPGPLKALSQRCVLNEAGEVWCWATNNGGQWGDGTAARNCDAGCPGLNLRAGHRAKLPPAVQIASSGGQVCAITHAAEVWCWGDSMVSEHIDMVSPQPLPAKVELLGNDNLRVYAGDHWCVEKLDHRLFCWGNNNYQQISDQPCTPRSDCPLTEVKFSCEK